MDFLYYIFKFQISLYLPPIFIEVLPEHCLSGVLMVQHLGKEQRHFFSSQTQLHLLTCTYRHKNITNKDDFFFRNGPALLT